MNVVLLCGGRGLRLPEETIERPKPLVEIGNLPILHHILKIYSHWGHNEFTICLGYKGYNIKEYFLNLYSHLNDITLDVSSVEIKQCQQIKTEPWKVNLVNTGEYTETGGRILCIRPYIYDNIFLLSYGDGLTNANLNAVIDFHNKNNKLVTFLAVKAPNKFGAVNFDNNGVVSYFGEKSHDGSYINGGFFVCNTEIFKYIKDDKTSWEFDVLPELVKDRQVSIYKYDGFWKCMDSLKDKEELCKMWDEGKAPWKIW